jgi:hypothetical protein
MPIVKSPEDLDYDHLEKLYERKIFDDYKPEKISSRMYEEVKVSTDKLTFKLIDKNQRDLVSLIHGEKQIYHNIEYFEIIWTFSKFPKQGNLTYLFQLLVYEFEFKVLSDKYHTSPGSKDFWESHIKKNKFEVYRLNLESNYKRNAKRFEENQIWDIESTFTDDFIKELPDFEDFKTETPEEDNDLDYQNELIESFERDTTEIDSENNEIGESIEKSKEQR